MGKTIIFLIKEENKHLSKRCFLPLVFTFKGEKICITLKVNTMRIKKTVKEKAIAQPKFLLNHTNECTQV